MSGKEKKVSKSYLISLLIGVLPIIVSVIFYKDLPDKLPQNFGSNGIEYGDKIVLAIIIPAIMVVVNSIITFIIPAERRKGGAMAIIHFVFSIIALVLLGVIGYYILK